MENYPKTLGELYATSAAFPTDFPVVNDTVTPDATKTLKRVIAHAIYEKYKYHHIFTSDEARFEDSIKFRLYNKMAQHQYWIDEYLDLIADGQFFYNEEWNDGGHTTTLTNNKTLAETDNETKARTANSASSGEVKKADTPQNSIADIDNYLTSAENVAGNDSGTESETNANTKAGTVGETQSTTYDTDLHIKKSTLGDITVQFRNFANFPSFLDDLIEVVAPCFITFYNDDIDLDA